MANPLLVMTDATPGLIPPSVRRSQPRCASAAWRTKMRNLETTVPAER